MRTRDKKELIEILERIALIANDKLYSKLDCYIKQLKSELNFYEVTSVSKSDLEMIYKAEDVAKLTDEDMERLASKLANAYCDNGFWIDLEIIASDRFHLPKLDSDFQD
jgi:hypothetical protein